jgi:hypothetical protein
LLCTVNGEVVILFLAEHTVDFLVYSKSHSGFSTKTNRKFYFVSFFHLTNLLSFVDLLLFVHVIGGTENYLRARRHYTISLNRQGPQINLRALYGLMAACKKLDPVFHVPPTSSSA